MTRYRVELTEPAEAELDTAYLSRSQRTSPEDALQWYRALQTAILSLGQFPRRCPRVPGYEGDVRRLLHGRGAGAYQIVYRVTEPADDEAEGVVRVLHIFHGARL